MNPIASWLNNFRFTVDPYICRAVFFMGSLARFDRGLELGQITDRANGLN